MGVQTETIGALRFIGQPDVQEQVYIVMRHSIIHHLPLPHLLLTGAAGLGKTTLSREIAKLMSVPFYEQPAQTYTTKVIQTEIPKMKPRSILFIDEVHRLRINAEELLYSIMQDQRLGNVTMPHISVIGATTIEGMLSKPFRDRFMTVLHFRDYNLGELVAILEINGCTNRIVASEIALRSRGVPRIAKSLYEFCRQYADTKSMDLDIDVVEKVCGLKKIDKYGLMEDDRRLLMALAYRGQPMGVDALSHTLDIDSNTIKGVLEHFLLKMNFIEISSDGRKITGDGTKYLESQEMLEE